MPAQVSLQLVLEPGAREGTIEGHLQDERGVDHSFSSWLGLLSLLEAARARARPPARTLAGASPPGSAQVAPSALRETPGG